jgi:hypothetical protein
LVLTGELSKLPGFEAYKAIVRELAMGLAESVSIHESPSDATSPRRFAPVLQCLEAASISSAAGSGRTLKLVADKINIDVRWSLEGEPPNRLLTLMAIRTGA